MEIREFTDKYGIKRYSVVSQGLALDNNGVGYKTPESARVGYYRELALIKKMRRVCEWRALKQGPWGRIIVNEVTGKKLSYKLLEDIIKRHEMKLRFSIPVLYNLIKSETNKESCYTV